MKKLSIKQKQKIKSILKKVGIGLSIAFNVIFSFILIASLVIYSRGDKANDTIHTEVIKSKYSPTKTYTGNIITTPNDIADTDILGGVYGQEIFLSPYIAFRDFTYEINTYMTSSVEYYTPNSISTRTFMRSVFYDKDGTFQGTDYDFSFDLLTKDKTHPVINGYTINYIEIRPKNELRCEWWINTTRNNTTSTNRYMIMNAGHSPYGYSSANQTLFTELFSGKYYFPKLNVYDSLQVQRYKGLISCLSQYAINYLDMSINKDITESISLFTAFRPMGYVPLNSKTGSYLMYKPNAAVDGGTLAGNIFLLYGDFHYNGEIYKELRLYYSFIHLSISSNSPTHKFNVSLNSIPYTEIDIGTSCDILYLSSIVCANNMNSTSANPRPDINIAFPVIMGSALTGTSTISRNVDIYSKSYNPNDTLLYATAIADTGFIAYDNGTSNLATDLYNYEISLGFFDYTNRFYFNYDNGSPYYYIEGMENDNGISNGTTALTDVFIIINNGFTGLTGLLNYYLLPGITLGTLVSIPVVLTILLFVIKMFKR